MEKAKTISIKVFIIGQVVDEFTFSDESKDQQKRKTEEMATKWLGTGQIWLCLNNNKTKNISESILRKIEKKKVRK